MTTSGHVAPRHTASPSGGHTRGHQPQPSTFRLRWRSSQSFRVVELDDNTVDPAVWGKNFPIQYDLYKRTVDQQRTRYGGSEALPRTPSSADPRSVVSQSKLAEHPRLVTMWSGYAFATDFREERDHDYALVDQRNTKRVTEFKQPGACTNCHASTDVLMKQLGKGDLKAGFDQLNKMTFPQASAKLEHPVSCIDCHDPKTMALRITRPAFMEGIKVYKASQGIKGYDVNRDASAQEKRGAEQRHPQGAARRGTQLPA